jgi:hypothetical protein
MEKRAHAADALDIDLGALLAALLIDAELDAEQIAMAAGGHAGEHGISFIQRKAVVNAVGEETHALWPGHKMARQAIGQRRLADALRAADQPGSGDGARRGGLGQATLCFAVPQQTRIGARRRRQGLGMVFMQPGIGGFLGRAHSRRSETAAAILPLMASSGPSASTTTQRSGSAAAISRKAVRRRS